MNQVQNAEDGILIPVFYSCCSIPSFYNQYRAANSSHIHYAGPHLSAFSYNTTTS